MNKQDAYTQGFNDKLATAGQHVVNLYNQFKDKLTGNEPSVPGQAAIGGLTGAGIGGMGALYGHETNNVLASAFSNFGSKTPISPSTIPEVLGRIAATGKGFMGHSPAWTQFHSMASLMGKHPIPSIAIPAGVMAIISGIRAHDRQHGVI